MNDSEQEAIDRLRDTENMHPDKNEWNYAETRVRHARLLAKFNRQPGQKRDLAHRLVDMLPSSLVKLRLCMPFQKGVRRIMFKGLRDLKETMLPELRNIAFEDVVTVNAKFERACQIKGIELELQDVEDGSS